MRRRIGLSVIAVLVFGLLAAAFPSYAQTPQQIIVDSAVQGVPTITVAQTVNVTCSASPCTINFSSTASGSTIAIAPIAANGSTPTGILANTTGGGFVLPAGTEESGATGAKSTCFSYKTGTAGADTSIEIFETGITTVFFGEIDSTRTILQNGVGTNAITTATSSASGVTIMPTLSGKNNVNLQVSSSTGGISSVSAGWVANNSPNSFPNGNGAALQANVSTIATPTWTQSSGTNNESGILFEDGNPD